MEGLTLDSGALIAFERQDRRVMAHLKEALQRGVEVTIPAIVVAEVWRGGPRAARLAALLSASVIEPLHEPLARVAGAAMGAIKNSAVVDAVVMASASLRGDRVLTTDYDDLSRLGGHFRTVRILRL
jgi:predicted nucleic acid-binding protein